MIGSRLQPNCARVLIGAVHVGEARRQDDAGGEVIAGFGQRGETRQLRQRDVHAEGAGAAAPAFHAFAEVRRQRVRRHQLCVEQLRIDVRGDGVGAQRAAVVEHDAGDAVALDDDFAHTGRGLDLDAMLAGGAGEGGADRAHAADGVAPHPFLAVHLAEGVVQHHVGGAGREGARVVADHGVEAEQGFDEFALEPAVQIIRGRFGEEVEQRAGLLHRQMAQAVGDAERAEEFAEAAPRKTRGEVRRRLQHQAAQHVGDGVDFAVEGGVAFGVFGGELRQLLRHAAVGGEEVAAVRRRHEILRAALDDFEPVPRERKVGDDLGIEQAHGVGGDGIAETGMEFRRHRRAAHDCAALDDFDPQAGTAEIGRAGEAVVAGADDDDVVSLHRKSSRVRRVARRAAPCSNSHDPLPAHLAIPFIGPARDGLRHGHGL